MQQSHGCKEVIALDGGPSSSAYDRNGEKSSRAGDKPEVAIPNFLVFYNKSA